MKFVIDIKIPQETEYMTEQLSFVQRRLREIIVDITCGKILSETKNEVIGEWKLEK